jgi:hypothetical protein
VPPGVPPARAGRLPHGAVKGETGHSPGGGGGGGQARRCACGNRRAVGTCMLGSFLLFLGKQVLVSSVLCNQEHYSPANYNRPMQEQGNGLNWVLSADRVTEPREFHFNNNKYNAKLPRLRPKGH